MLKLVIYKSAIELLIFHSKELLNDKLHAMPGSVSLTTSNPMRLMFYSINDTGILKKKKSEYACVVY